MGETNSSERSDRGNSSTRAERGGRASEARDSLSDTAREKLSGSDATVKDRDPPSESRAAAQERMAAEAAPSKDRVERQMADTSRQTPANQSWTQQEQTAIQKGTDQGIEDAVGGWVSDAVDGVVEIAKTAGQGIIVGANNSAKVLSQSHNPLAKVAGTIADWAIPDSFSQRQAASLQNKATAALEQIKALPDVPEALKEKYQADFALADAMEATYRAGKADISLLEESARIRAQATTEIGILAAETGSVAIGGAGAVVKVVRAAGKIDFDKLPGGAIGALNRATKVSQSLADDLRRFAADESGSVTLELRAPGQKIDRDWFKQVQAGRQFDADNAHRYQYNEITVEYEGNKSDYARVDSINLTEGTPEIVSRKFTQFADIQIDTARTYLRELSTKYPEGAVIADTPKNRALGIEGRELKGSQVLEVPVQDGPIPKEVLDYAKELRIRIRDVDGKVYS